MPGHQLASSSANGISPHAGHAPPRAKVTPTKKHHDRPGDKPVGLALDSNGKAEKGEKKNVSHVPCKFFRQSICQAGDKCPFSHELDSQTQAVCKYYQKGNCKFGAKCALAHITADGRQVNKKPLKEPKDSIIRRKERPKDEIGDSVELSPQQSRSKTGSASSDTTIVDSSVQTASRILSKYSGSGQPASMHMNQPQTGPPSLHAVQNAQPGSPRMNFNAKPFTVRSLSSSLPQTGTQRPLAQLSSLSLGSTGTGASAPVGMSPPMSQPGIQGTSWTSYRSLFEGSAIADDDDDTLEDTDLVEEEEEEEEGFQEQLVPSTLTDLLTPLERERRNSRSSAQKSGRVFSSPSAVSSPFGFGMRRASSGATNEVLSSSAPLQDLWSPRPRNQVFPVQRPPDQQEGFETRVMAKAPIGTQFEHELPPLEMDGAYQPFQQFNRAIAR